MVLSVATEKIPSVTTGNQSRDRPTSSLAIVRYFKLKVKQSHYRPAVAQRVPGS